MPFMGRRREDVDKDKEQEIDGADQEQEQEIEESNEFDFSAFAEEVREAFRGLREVVDAINDSMAVLATEGIYINDVPEVKKEAEKTKDEIDELEDLDFDI